MIFTKSSFFYGNEIDENNFSIDFNEGAGELNANLVLSGYTFTDLALEIARAMTSVGSQDYTVTINRETKKLIISAPLSFDLLFLSGTNNVTTSAIEIGFEKLDYTASNSYESINEVCLEYRPQFLLQSYIALEDWQDQLQVSANESASGVPEVVSFADINFTEFNIMMANDYDQNSSVIEKNLNGVADLRNFMKYIVKKFNIEFIPDRENKSSFEKLIIESTRLSKNGVGFKLYESYGKGLVGYYETKNLKFRGL